MLVKEALGVFLLFFLFRIFYVSTITLNILVASGKLLKECRRVAFSKQLKITVFFLVDYKRMLAKKLPCKVVITELFEREVLPNLGFRQSDYIFLCWRRRLVDPIRQLPHQTIIVDAGVIQYSSELHLRVFKVSPPD